MDQEQLEILKRYCNPIPANTVDMIAKDLGCTTKEVRARVRGWTKQLIEYYEVKEGLGIATLR